MTRRLRHRGPDATGIRDFANCSLGHTRLRILDLSALGDQPMTNEDESVWVAFNGEIYNFVELRAELTAAGHRFRSKTDTEVLVHLYEEHGDGMAARLRGMFAFAVWDERQQRLLLCRDRLGIKPLYYRSDNGCLRFASETRVLGSGDIDPVALRGFLRLGWVPGPATIWSGVSELPPGHLLTWHAGSVHTFPYWSFAQSPAATPSVGEVRDALTDAMARHLVADVPVGLFLSSGVDSAVVGSLAAQCSAQVRAYTVAFDTGDDEAGGAAAIALRLGIEHTVVRVDSAEAMSSIDRFVDTIDQPTVDGLNSWVISRAVRDAGPVVALSGLGGDELFAGYSTFRHVPRLKRLGGVGHRLPGWARRGSDRAVGGFGPAAHSRYRRAMEAVASGGWENSYCAVRGLFGNGELDAVWPAGRDVNPVPMVFGLNGDGISDRGSVTKLEMSNYLPFQLLRDTDCMSMAHALEVRVPLLDDEVVTLAMAGQLSPGPWDKGHLVAAADPSLGSLVGQKKQTFTLPIDGWMTGPLREKAFEAIVALGDSGLGFDRRSLTDLWSDYRLGRVGWRPVWALAVLGMWRERQVR
ncbi:MAG: asparagine synthase (glutamine-hydrolyzing) [Actinomycetota bacterium]|nr:asparagine synthase (glutamine-hydrolyzing) [Actinomycetota bacterium]